MWKYTGGSGGSDFVPGVPAQDLTDEQMEDLEKGHPGLKKNGLWKHEAPPAPAPAPKTTLQGGAD